MAGLSAASLLAQSGVQLTLLEQNWIPGGCTTTYWRKGFWFESGATTLVGLGEHMPLQAILDRTGIQFSAQKLATPMQVLLDGQLITRHEELEAWIVEAERVFGTPGQAAFWRYCYRIANLVWRTSTKQLHFPPDKVADLWEMTTKFRLEQLSAIPAAFTTMDRLLKRFGLSKNDRFCRFVDEQLLITAQNKANEVNVLFGATALCYTNFPNWYVPGGLRNLVGPFVKFIENKGGRILLKTVVTGIKKKENGYLITTNQGNFEADLLISSIPLNNLARLWEDEPVKQKLQKYLLPAAKLNSAFQMGIGFKPHRQFDALHFQLHLDSPLPQLSSASIFVSLHPTNDTERAPKGQMAASVSTHWPNPEKCRIDDTRILEEAIINALESHNFLRRENVVYAHSSGPKSWEKWTGRQWGFVGGYPQYKHIKPWQMKSARLDGQGAYVCGDSSYPGQGIPGACLSGLIAFEKLAADHQLWARVS